VAKFKWNLSSFEEIRRLPKVGALIDVEVQAILDDVGRDHYDGGVESGRTRTRGYVVTKDYEGIKENSERQTLASALGRRMGGTA
jgi:hypothetical protein